MMKNNKFSYAVIFVLLINFFSFTFEDIPVVKNYFFISTRKIRVPQSKKAQLKAYFRKLGVGEKDIEEIIKTYHQTLGLSLKKHIQPKVEYFISLGLSKKEVSKLIKTSPSLFSYRLETNLQPTIDYFVKKFNISKKEVIIEHSRVLGYSLEKNIKPKVNLLKKIGVRGNLASHFFEIAPLNLRVCQLIAENVPYNIRPPVIPSRHTIIPSGYDIAEKYRFLNLVLKEYYGKTAAQLIKEGREDLVREEIIFFFSK